MAPLAAPKPAFGLRQILRRLDAAPADQLPHIVPSLANALPGCRELVGYGGQTAQKSPYTVLVDTLKDRLSTLIRRDMHSRWAAIVLIKACIGVVGMPIVQNLGAWLPELLNALKVSHHDHCEFSQC